MAIQFIIDAGCDLNAEQAKELDVTLIPMTITFGCKEYQAGVDITHEEFYNKLVAGKDLPTTSQPTPYAYECVYQQVKNAGNEAVVLCLSSVLSGTYQSASIAADGFEDCIHVVDTRSVTAAQRLLLEYGMILRDRGLSAKQIAAELEQKKEAKKYSPKAEESKEEEVKPANNTFREVVVDEVAESEVQE